VARHEARRARHRPAPAHHREGHRPDHGTNAYTFLVAPYANKVQIRRSIEELFGVTVLGCAHDDAPRQDQGSSGKAKVRRPDWKRAVVSLAEGQSVEFL
jgi:large subunit ribosomal protein L23